MRRITVALIASLWATAGHPGAWPREAGETFLSAKGAFASGDEATYALYAERGVTARLTLGGKYDRLTPTLGVAETFARWHFSSPEDTWQIAVEGGVGTTLDTEPETWPTWRDRVTAIAALHLGRGIPTPLGGGWVDMRLGSEWPMNDDPRRLKLDATAGIALASGPLVMLDLRHEAVEDESLTLVGPATAIGVGERLHVTAGVMFDASGELEKRFELGAWLKF